MGRSVVFNPCSCCGGGEGVSTECCDNAIPSTLYATFSGSLSSLGTVTIVYGGSINGFTTWVGTPADATCETGDVHFFCNNGDWTLVFGNNPSVSYTGVGEDSCSPFLFTNSGNYEGMACSGIFGITVSETPP